MTNDKRPSSANDVDIVLAGNFLKARITARLGISEVSTFLGLSEHDYCAAENAKTRISPVLVARMAKLTKRPIKWFYLTSDHKENKQRSDSCDEIGLQEGLFPKTPPSAGIKALLKKLQDI